jgi:hypothetical protein
MSNTTSSPYKLGGRYLPPLLNIISGIKLSPVHHANGVGDIYRCQREENLNLGFSECLCNGLFQFCSRDQFTQNAYEETAQANFKTKLVEQRWH